MHLLIADVVNNLYLGPSRYMLLKMNGYSGSAKEHDAMIYRILHTVMKYERQL